MTQREISFSVPPDVARERLTAGLAAASNARVEGDRIEYEYLLTTNYFGRNEFFYLIAGRLQASQGGSVLRLTVTEIPGRGKSKKRVAIAAILLGFLAMLVGLVASGNATVVFALWFFLASTVPLGGLIAFGFLGGAWFGREAVASKAAKQLQEIVAARR